MGFKSFFPFFNRDEVTPSETDENPDVESRIGRTLARLQGFSNILNVFKFIRSDYNGRLHVTQAPTDFDNFHAGSVVTVIGTAVLVPANPDRQFLMVENQATVDISLNVVVGGLDVFFIGILPGDVVSIIGFTQAFSITSTVAGDTVKFFEA